MANMHSDFGKWYRVLTLSPTPDLLNLRWKAVSELSSQELNDSQVIDLIRLSCGARSALVDGTSLIRETARTADPQFPTSANDLEIHVLAAATLASLLKKPGRRATLAALGLASATTLETTSSSLLPNLAGHAQRYLYDRAVAVRKLGPQPDAASADPLLTALKSFHAAQERYVEDGASETTTAALAKEAQSVKTRANQLVTAIKKHCNAIAVHEVIWKEEAQILWWHIGRTQHAIDGSRGDFQPESCLIMGDELASRVLLLPGPIYARAMLSDIVKGAGRTADPVRLSVKDVVSSAPEAWKSDWLERVSEAKDETCGLCPISSLLWGETSSIDTDARLFTAVEVAHQFYIECLLLQELTTNHFYA